MQRQQCSHGIRDLRCIVAEAAASAGRNQDDDEYGELENGIHPDWLLVERVIDKEQAVHGWKYLVKCAPAVLDRAAAC